MKFRSGLFGSVILSRCTVQAINSNSEATAVSLLARYDNVVSGISAAFGNG